MLPRTVRLPLPMLSVRPPVTLKAPKLCVPLPIVIVEPLLKPKLPVTVSAPSPIVMPLPLMSIALKLSVEPLAKAIWQPPPTVSLSIV
jgi:hypothetical protein